MKNVLVTGGLGFIGSNFVNFMTKKHPEIKIVVIDKLDYCASRSNIHDLDGKVEVVIGDIANSELVMYILEKFEIDTIVHFAAQTHVDNSFLNSITFTQNNVLGTHVLLEVARKYAQEHLNRLEKFVHVSTDEVYGEVTNDSAKTEMCKLNPTNPYAASKTAAEHMVNSYYISYGLPIVITRGNNVYGPNQFPEKVIPKFICQMLRGEKLTIQGTGNSRRNFIHVDDVCTAFETILYKGKIGETYNISSNHTNEYTVQQVAETIVGLFHPNQIYTNYLTTVEDRNFNDCRYFISSKKLEELGWSPQKTNFTENVKDLIEFYRNRN